MAIKQQIVEYLDILYYVITSWLSRPMVAT
jgi:hypothetical protein